MRVGSIAVVLFALSSAPALAAGWAIEGAPGAPKFQLSRVISADRGVRYIFDCSGAANVLVTQTAVTQILDFATNQTVPDDAATLPESAAMMALSLDEGQPNFVKAKAARNAAKGWDLTIEVAKKDPTFLGLPKAKMFTLFTTGYTIGVVPSEDDRKVLADFVGRCSATP